ncbi:hypothetical protein BT93_D1947 [Corymbia citriodora subsp. variegata]|nr:hypothetical protein BT93_D1947 [Corymbia citriodora subsp. variegata]
MSSSSPSSSSPPPSCPKKMITLRSSDGETFEIEEAAALQSRTLENMIDENCASTPIPLPNVNGKILAKVVEFCNKHAEAGVDAESLRAWDAEFVNVEKATVFDYVRVRTPISSFSIFDGFLWRLQISWKFQPCWTWHAWLWQT